MPGLPETLTDIGARCGTNKSRCRGKPPYVPLTAIYEPYLAPLRDRPLRVLELGVEHGASLRMWREYFPRAEVFGVDRQRRARKHAEDRIRIFIGDQKDPDTLDAVVAQSGPLDLVVDDGGHRPADQQLPLLYLWRSLRAGGLYVIEDIHTSYRLRYRGGWRKPGTTAEFLKGVLDDVHAPIHKQQTTLADLEFLHVYLQACVLKKLGPETVGSEQ